MIALVRADSVKLISDGADGWIAVPDLALPEWVEWGAYEIPGQPAFHIWFQVNGRRIDTLWYGPKMYLGTKLFIVDTPGDDDRAILTFLRNRLGGHGMATPLHRAIRNRPSIWTWIKAQGWFSPVRNANNRIVGMRAPLTICGRPSYDLDGDEPDTAEELLDD